jgi:GH35 family endo-1,4-beta-xylanase
MGLMLQFEVHHDGAPAKDIDLSGAYLFGQDGIPMRAEISAQDGLILCEKRPGGASGLALLWDAGQAGRLLLPTCRLPDRDKPYNLSLELARAQTMRIAQKREDWGLFDYADAEALNAEYDVVRGKLIAALKARGPDASALADDALLAGLALGERMSLYHADIFINRRKAAGGGAMRMAFGCTADLSCAAPACQERLRETFDFLSIPMPWKQIEPKERTYEYDRIDAWTAWAARNRKAVHAGPLLSFHPTHLPDWLYLWENDYDALREMVYEHIQRTVKRYEKSVHYWKVVCGIHASNDFNLTFEQLMELTRMTCQLVKKASPRSMAIIEMVMPWSEYYARNQRSIPLLLYADMAVQSGVKFDAFGLQFCTGAPVDGHYLRDLLQISSMLDEFVVFGKPLHITACQAPSDVTPDATDAWSGQADVAKAGHWHLPWSQRLQAEWLQAFYRIGMSKPFVESICWRDLSDSLSHYIPHGGLLDGNNEPKLAYKELRNFKASLLSDRLVVMNQQRRGQST